MGLLSVDVRAPKLSNFNRSLKKRTSMAPGILYPVLFETCVPGDQIKLDIQSLVKTNALLAPLMGTFKLQFDYYFCPWRLYIKEFANNAITVANSSFGTFDNVRFPFFNWPSVYEDPNFVDGDSDMAFNPNGYLSGENIIPWQWTNAAGSLFDYMGFPVGYQNLERSQSYYNALPFISYVDIFRNYYMNPQESTCPWYGVGNISSNSSNYYYNPQFASVTTGNMIATSSLDKLIHEVSNNYTFLTDMMKAVNVSNGGLGFFAIGNSTQSYTGLFSRTHRPDMYTTILNSGYVDALNTSTRINVTNNSVTTDQIRTSFKFYRERAISLLAGTRLDEWIRGQFGVKTAMDSVIPELLGTTSTYIDFEDVVSKSATEDEPLGSLGGRGVGYLDGRPHFFRPTEYGTLVVIASIQPIVDYFQGISPWLRDLSMNDVFVPALDCIGFEDIPRAELSAFPDLNNSGVVDLTASQDISAIWDVAVGKRPAWLKYHTNVNRLHGDFADSLRYWTLGRQFSFGQTYGGSLTFDPSAYIDPREFSYIFADPMEQNFFVQMSFNMVWKRPISKRLMPTI